VPRSGSSGAARLSVAAADEAIEIDGEKLPLHPQRRRRTRALLWTLGSIALVGSIASLLIVPSRAWMNQRREYAALQKKLEAVDSANAALEAQIDALQRPEEIERIARDRYNLVKAGDQVLAILPDPAPEPLPAVWPFTTITDIITIRLQHPESIPVPATPSTATTVPTATTAPAAPATTAGG
jgi:cell division protein FtsB